MMAQSEAAYHAASGVSTADELSKLGELRAQGVINDQEYEDLQRRTWRRRRAGRRKRPRAGSDPARAGAVAEPRAGRAASSRARRCGKGSGPPQRGARPAFVGRRLVRARRPRSSACRERPGRRDRVPPLLLAPPARPHPGRRPRFHVERCSRRSERTHSVSPRARPRRSGKPCRQPVGALGPSPRIGVGALLWTSSRSVIALRRVFALVWGVPPPRGGNPLIEALAFSGICAVLAGHPGTTAWLRDLAGAGILLLALLAVAAFFGIWLWVSTCCRTPMSAQALVPGAILMAVGAQIVHLFTVFTSP